MSYATLINLAHLAGYEVTLTCDPYAGEYLLRRGGTALTFGDARELANHLRDHVELMVQLADRLG